MKFRLCVALQYSVVIRLQDMVPVVLTNGSVDLDMRRFPAEQSEDDAIYSFVGK